MQSLVQELIDQLQNVLSTTLGSDVGTEPATASGKAWTLHVTMTGLPTLTVAFDEVGADELTRAWTGQEPSGEATAATLRDLCGQAAAAIGNRSSRQDNPVDIRGPELDVWPAPDTGVVTGFGCAALPVLLILNVVADDENDTRTAVAKLATPATPRNLPERFDVLLDMDLPLVVRFGRTELPLKALSRLGPGSLIDLSRAPDDPVEVLVSDRVVARGEVVVVAGNYGIRITDVATGRDDTGGV